MHPAFEVHMLNEVGKHKARLIAEDFDRLLENLYRTLTNVPAGEISPEAVAGRAYSSREFSVVITKLEEACFFAKKAMANQPENQATP